MKKLSGQLSEVPLFQEGFTSVEDYEKAGCKGYEPMTAKELDTEEKQEEAFNNPNNFIEEKFDGTRNLVHFFRHYSRVFSRRISKKTGFYVENTDNVPQIRDIVVPDLKGTILDGEMFIPNRDFEESCGIMNCKYDKAIQRQKEIGFEVFHAFDILFYHGIDLRRMELQRRKVYLELAVQEASSPYIEMVDYYSCGSKVTQRITGNWLRENLTTKFRASYPHLWKDLLNSEEIKKAHAYDYMVALTPQSYYEYIVATGGEGVIIKPKDGRYYHKRGWEYSKIKKF